VPDIDEAIRTGDKPKELRALRTLVRENYGELTLNIDPDSIYTGALGAATFAWRAVNEEGKVAERREHTEERRVAA